MDITTITIYNRSANNTAPDTYLRTVLNGCHVFYEHEAVDGTSKSSAVVRVMERNMRKPFAVPSLWRTMTAEQRQNYWTATESDIIVVGICDKEISFPSELREKKYETISVKGYTDNRRGVDILRHIKIVGA